MYQYFARSRGAAVVRGAGLAVLLALTGVPAPAGAAVDATPAEVPSALTPDVRDSAVAAILDAGEKVVVGGAFTRVRDQKEGPERTRRNLFAFRKATGAVDADFAPEVDGEIRVVIAGPNPGTVYIGGRFTAVNGLPARRVALLNVDDGSLVAGFRPPALDGLVKDLALVGDRLLVAGTFTAAGGQRRNGLASVDARTGALDDYLATTLTGNHNHDGTPDTAQAPVGAENLAVSPDGQHLVVIGNFRLVDGVPRHQVVRLDLGADRAAVRDWATDAFQARCAAHAYDFWVRDVSFAPDGSYFVVATAGGSYPETLCDTVTRWETARTGEDQVPTWVSASGGDTFLSAVAGASSVFVGGHFRWLNNPLGDNRAAPGAVGRASIAALDPASGLPQRWNPGRNPRGYGVDELHLTREGLWMGSDTAYVGAKEWRRERIAFFPRGDLPVHPRTTPSLPGDVYQLAAGGARARRYDGAHVVGAPRPITVPADLGRATAAFWVGGTLFHVTDGVLHRRGFDGRTVGAPVRVDPYHDRKWDTVETGSQPHEGQTYRGAYPHLYEQLGQLTGAFYTAGRLYYTLAGRSALYWRWCDPDSGTVGAQEFLAAVPPGADLAASRGVFVAGRYFYQVDGRTGALLRRAWTGANPWGAATVVS
ncbi:MAG TPA: hypothetical protein VFY17_00235, partial [Pilimelia sp.]|nr:hypothetical protein [Pilimelia sp.]